MKNDTFGFFLRDLREQNGLSQSQLGRLAGVSDKAVSKWENDTARPQSRLLYRLASVLGVTVDELLCCRRRPPENKGEGVCKMKDGLWKQAHHALRVRYGEALPVGVLNRYLSEFEALRMTDAILCFELLRRISVRAAETGEHVRAKGAIGSSFIAFVMGATEVNPLKAHTFCPNCRRFEWADGVRCGWDIPEKRCACGAPLLRDGHDVPFAPLQETVHCLRLDLSVSYGGCKTVRETVRSFFADVPVVTLRRKAYPKLETLVAVTENIPGLTDGQTLPFEEYGILLRNCPGRYADAGRRPGRAPPLGGRYGNILPCGCIRRPGGAGSCQSGRDAGCAGIVLGAVSGNPRHVAIADLSRCDSGAGAAARRRRHT